MATKKYNTFLIDKANKVRGYNNESLAWKIREKYSSDLITLAKATTIADIKKRNKGKGKGNIG